MKMNKSAYGLCDAPLLWWREADRRLRQMKMVRHRLDKCCYMLYDTNDQIVILLILHVDDILLGMDKHSQVGQDYLVKLKKAFDFGKWQELTVDKPVHYCGGRICLLKDGSLSLDFQEYLKKVMPVTIAKGRNGDDPMTGAEISKARGILGALQWPATQACPHLNATVSLLAADISNGKVQVLQELNKALRFAKNAGDFKLVMKKVFVKPEEMCFICYSDAAFGVRSDGASQGGFIMVMTSIKALTGESVPYNVVGWRSFKLNRVCRSSLSAESQACSGALDELVMIKTLTSLMFDSTSDPRADATAASCGRSAVVIDAKGLYDALKKDGIGSGADKRASIDILCTKEEISRLACDLRWVSSERMLADGLTKMSARQGFPEMLGSGYLKLVNDTTFTAAKKKDKDARAASTASTFGRNKIAGRISLVVMSQAVARADAAEEEPDSEESSFFYVLLTFGIASVILVMFFGMRFLKQRVLSCADAFFSRKEVLKVNAEVQTEVCLQVLSPVLEEADMLRDALEHLSVASQQVDAQRVQRINELTQEKDRLLRAVFQFSLHADLSAFYTRSGQCWHVFEDCRMLERSDFVWEKSHLCKICIDRARTQQREWAG